jgi:hypothetical protein
VKKQRIIATALVLLLLLLSAGCKGASPVNFNSPGSGPAQTAGEQAGEGTALAGTDVPAPDSAASSAAQAETAGAGDPQAAAATGSIETSLKDGALQKGSKKTFDVWAKDGNGKKISKTDLTVTLNGQTVPVTWDDTAKTSYTLVFSTSGANTVTLKAGSAVKTYTLYYEPAQAGERIGQMVMSVEAFTISGGYLLNPLYVDIKEGENGAQLLDRVLKGHGYTYQNTGTLSSNFYLAVLEGGVLPVKAKVPEYLKEKLLKNGFQDLNENDDLNSGGLGEFNYTHGSGWMYCVNTRFPNVGLADYYPADGDVMRLQFTLAYGADIGGGAAVGAGGSDGNYYSVADKDGLTALIAQKGYANVPEKARAIVTKLNASQTEVDEAVKMLKEGTA